MYRIRPVVALLAIGVFFSSAMASSTRLASNSPFKLPVPPGVYVEVTQGNNMPSPDWDHNGLSAYAFDFALLTGTYNFVVTAAQGGNVISVDDSSTTRCDGFDHEAGTPKDVKFSGCWTHANYVLIADDDGTTAALYMHLLTHSAKVQVGYHVKQGQQLGLADTTGYALGNPHLHFQVEEIPSQDAQQNKPDGWWFTQSVPVSFSNPEVMKQRRDGVPITNDRFCLGDKTCSSAPPPTILPGGMWTDPSPNDGQVVSDVIHFAAHAYPTHSGDPAIAQVNFTVGSQGTWKVACTALPPATGDVFVCDANLKDLGVPYGQIQASFDVYDQAGNVSLAPNGVHALNYASTLSPSPTVTPTLIPTATPPTPVPVPTPTPIPPTLNVSPSSRVNNFQGCSTETHGGSGALISCPFVLSNSTQTTSILNWSVSASNPRVIFDHSSGTLAPGQSITINAGMYGNGMGEIGCPFAMTLVFKGSINTIQVPLICTEVYTNPDAYSFDNTYCSHNGNWVCVITVTADSQNAMNTTWVATVQTPDPRVVFSPTQGTLAPGATVQVTITILNSDCPGNNIFYFYVPGALPIGGNYLGWSC